MIVQQLREIQERVGYLPRTDLEELARRLDVPLHRLHEVASFFPHYRFEPPSRAEVRVCRDMACHLRGSDRLQSGLENLGRELGEGQLEVCGVSCLGQCDRAPAVAINDQVYRGLTDGEVRSLVRAAVSGQELEPQHADTTSLGWLIDVYAGEPRFDAVRRFVENRDADSILAALKDADLRGMGGAGFRTHLKWSLVRNAPGSEKYVVCNADESEPGTFKDRELMRRTPWLVLEGIILAGLVTGATRGYIYIRHEYEEEIEAMEEAIRKARSEGFCGDRILGSNLSFPVEVFVSPGGYICGEESALLEAMEDRRAEPRNKPPFPVLQGLYSKPTVINNVETLSWVPLIVLRGGSAYKDRGTRGASGMRFVSISGDVNAPGVYEVPFGQSVRELIETAGGMRNGVALKAIAPSGPSAGYLPAKIPAPALPEKFRQDHLQNGATHYDILDLPLDLSTLGNLGSMLGAAFLVVGQQACMVDMVKNITQFFRNESCGKCVPCRVGSQKLATMLEAITSGQSVSPDALDDSVPILADTMVSTSICGLGMVASNPMSTLLKYFRDELDDHILRRRCPAGVCSGLSR